MSLFEKLFGQKSLSQISLSSKYQVFTREFDAVVEARDLDRIIGRPSADSAAELEKTWQTFETALQHWKIKASLHAMEGSSRICSTMGSAEREEIVVSILVDQSGSMRGQSILLATAALDVAQDFLRHLGCKVELLGFTTSSWQGGNSRQRWKRYGRPERPGRLCDLLHIVYRSADDLRKSSMGYSLYPMLRPDLLKENVDGEALEWAASRLKARNERRKILIVLSDGVPVDDSTLAANDPEFLTRHLRTVIQKIEQEGIVELGAMGIAHDVSKFYARHRALDSADQLGSELLDFVTDVILNPTRRTYSEETP